MPVPVDDITAGRNKQPPLTSEEPTPKRFLRFLKTTTLIGLMYIVGRPLLAHELNGRMPGASSSLGMQLTAHSAPLLLSAAAPLPPTPPPARPSLATQFSLLPALQPAITRQLTLGERFSIYVKSTYGPEAIFESALDAAYCQMQNDQPEWGRGEKGYARRMGADYVPTVISNTITFGIAATDHEDPRRYLSHEHGVWPRTRYAIVHTFISQTDRGSPTFAFSRVAGTYGAAFIASAWLPERQAHFSSGFYRGSMALGWNVVYSVLREFGPDLKRFIRRD